MRFSRTTRVRGWIWSRAGATGASPQLIRLELAHLHLSDGDWDGAERLLSDVAEDSGDETRPEWSGLARLQLAYRWSRLPGREQEALEAFQEFIEGPEARLAQRAHLHLGLHGSFSSRRSRAPRRGWSSRPRQSSPFFDADRWSFHRVVDLPPAHSTPAVEHHHDEQAFAARVGGDPGGGAGVDRVEEGPAPAGVTTLVG